MRTRLYFFFAVVSLVAGIGSGCGGNDEPPPPERHSNALAAIDESRIRAAIDDLDVVVDVPVENRDSGTLRAELQVNLTNVATGETVLLRSAIEDVVQDEAETSYALRYTGLAEGLERSETGPMIIDWRLVIEDEVDLYGRKSLFAALGNLDVQVRGPTELPREGTAPVRVLVRDPSTHEAVAGAAVTVELVAGETVSPLFTGATDARGELLGEIALPDGVDSGSVRVSVLHDGVNVWTSRSVSRRTDDALYLGTDKTIYKPGQDVHLRLLALDGLDRRPVADSEVIFEARDARGNKVFRRTARTDSFGVASSIVPTDTRVNEGEWTFSANVAGRNTQVRIPVQAYVLPKMRVTVGGDRTFAMPGDTIRTRVSAQYLFGEPVREASVTLEARTTSGIPVGTYVGTTDDQGVVALGVAVPNELRSDALEESGDTLLLTATVVDPAAQTERGEGVMPLAAAPIRIQVIGDGALVAGEQSVLYVVVTDAVGRPLVADVTVGGDVDAALETNASGVAELRVTPEDADLALTLSATDGAGRSHARDLTLGAAGDGERLFVSTDRAIYRAGDRAVITVRATGETSRAYVDVYRGAIGVLSATVDLAGGEGSVELPITEDLGGLLVADAFAAGAEGRTLRAARPVLVERDDRLQIALRADRAEYGPGDEATIGVEITDAAGAPSIASVGLTVVDEAVFALGGEPTTSIRSSFGLDERVLPTSVNVAGRNANDLLNGTDSADREQLARLLFASAGDEVRGPSFVYDSLAEEIPLVVSSLTTKVQFDAQEYLTGLNSLVSRGWITEATLPRYVRAAHLVDPFGRAYHVAVEGGPDVWSQNMVLTSNGPDELAGTSDDVRASMPLYIALYGGYGWGTEEDADFAAGRAGGPMAGAPAPPADPSADGGGGAGQPRVRSDFRETAYVNPILITDASGRASVTVPLAHSITTWRVSADGSSADGRVGSTRGSLRTFQPFFVDFSLPIRLTSGDEIEVPAIVYNYTSEPQNVTVALEAAPWFEIGGAASQVVALGPSEVRAARFQLRITRAGNHALQLTGTAGALSDALVRTVDVQPEGQAEDETFSGRIDAMTAPVHSFSLPTDTVAGGGFLELVLTPGFASEAVQGVEALLQEPNGCFEQTTSSAWPNTLVAQYMEATGELTAERREEVIGMVTRGYQRLLTFESPTGGMNWWGDADPGNRILSAIMLWHLEDMEGLIETDAAFRDRTLEWLVSQQRADGSWESGDALHAGNETLGTSEARTTAFIAWALAHTGWADDAVERAAGWLRANVPPESDLYANALVANALALADPRGATTAMVFGRLDRMRVDLADGAGILWPTDAPSWTGTSGDTAAVETTGLVAYGLMQAGVYPDDVAGAMTFILGNKDAMGTWYNTQATMNALRALSAAVTGGGSDAVGTLVVTVDGVEAERIAITAENSDLHRRFDLRRFATVGAHEVRLAFTGEGQVSYRLTRTAFRPVLPPAEGPLGLEVSYSATSSVVGRPIEVIARATNRETSGMRDQVIVRVGRAPGFEPRVEDLMGLVAAGVASRYEVRTEDVTFYLMGVAAGETRELRFRMTPSLPVDATAPASRVYSYYEPSLQQTLAAERFVVTAE